MIRRGIGSMVAILAPGHKRRYSNLAVFMANSGTPLCDIGYYSTSPLPALVPVREASVHAIGGGRRQHSRKRWRVDPGDLHAAGRKQARDDGRLPTTL
jgi:hypothetical protein